MCACVVQACGTCLLSTSMVVMAMAITGNGTGGVRVGWEAVPRLKEGIVCSVCVYDALQSHVCMPLPYHHVSPASCSASHPLPSPPLPALSSPFMQPLFRAAALGHTRAVQMLLESGSSPDVRDNNGDTAAHVACNSHEFEIATILRDQLHDPQMINGAGRTVDEVC